MPFLPLVPENIHLIPDSNQKIKNGINKLKTICDSHVTIVSCNYSAGPKM